MVYGEYGRFPLEIKVRIRMPSFMWKILKAEKFSKMCIDYYMVKKKIEVSPSNGWILFNKYLMIHDVGYVFVNQDSYDY